MRRVGTGVAVLTTLLLWSGTARAQGFTPGAQVYELTETARLIANRKIDYEVSVSAMMGFARPGSQVCQAQWAGPAPGSGGSTDLRDSGPVCAITLTASNTVDLRTGLGPISGTFKVVLPDPINPHAVDAPELVVVKGSFDGNMDFSPAVISGIPYGTVTGVLLTNSGAPIPFGGVFVMPFGPDPNFPNLCDLINPTGNCYLTYSLSGVNPLVVTVTGAAPVTPSQRALGYPTARFDIYFQQ